MIIVLIEGFLARCLAGAAGATSSFATGACGRTMVDGADGAACWVGAGATAAGLFGNVTTGGSGAGAGAGAAG